VGNWLEIEVTQTGAVWLRHRLPLIPRQLAWRPQGNLLGAAAEDGAVALVELPPEGEPEPVAIRPTAGHSSLVTFADFTPDGAALVTTSWDGFTVFWDVLTRRKLLSESRQLVTGIGGEPPRALVFKPYPSRTAVARLWQREGFRVVAATDPGQGPPVGVSVSPDGRWLAVESAGGVTVFDPVTGRELARLPGVSPEFSAAGDRLWTCEGDRVLRFRALGSGARAFDTEGEIFFRTPAGTRANSVSLSPDGETLVVCAADDAVLLLDAATGGVRRELLVLAHYARLAADGKTLVTQFHNGPAHLARLENTNSIAHLGQHLNARFDATGRWLGLATEQMLGLFERNETNWFSRRHQVPLEGGAGAPATFTFSPDGQLAAVVFNRFDVRLYEPASGRVLAVLTAPAPAQIAGVRGLTFSADGTELFAAKQDGEIVAWHLPTLRTMLARMGLDWASPADEAATAAMPAGGGAKRGRVWAPVAVAAGTVALLAGVVVFALQRRMLSAYERAATLAEARQRSLIETQLALAQSQKLEALGTLAAGVAHDFNNLLSVIRMSNHFVAKAAPPDPVTRGNLEAIEQAVARGRDLVRSMLGYVRRADDDTGAFSVARVVGDTMGMLSRQFLSGLTLSLELDPRCPPVRGSAARLEQILLNLVVNAAEAMQGQGRLTVSARLLERSAGGVLSPATAGPAVELSVRDSGPGIAEGHLPRVFDPFFTTKQGGAQPGTGLGLSVVYTLAKQSGWGLRVESRPGEGAVFHVYLPIQEGKGDNAGAG
jgi:signal transduction histidine kinase